MRVTSNSFNDSLVTHLQVLARRQSTLQSQAATGQRVQTAADDPLAAQKVLTLRDDAVATAQYKSNIQTHKEFATVTSGALQSLNKVLDRAQEIAVSADDLDSPDSLAFMASEVEQLLQQAIGIANREYRGDYIFAGTKANQPAVTAAFNDRNQVQSVEFRGNGQQARSEIAESVLVTSRLAAHNPEGSGELGVFADARAGADVFQHLIALRDQLLSGDVSAIATTTRPNLKKDEDNVLYHIANNGALQGRLDAMLSLNKAEEVAIDSEISHHADADISEVVVRLTQQQTAFQATLQSAGSVMNLSLLSFLR